MTHGPIAPELLGAVSDAGVLGSVGAVYMSPSVGKGTNRLLGLNG